MVSSVSESSASYKDLRVSGLVSGMDTEETVDKLLIYEKNKVASLEADKQKYEWEQEAYREVMGDLQDFEDGFFDVLDSENSILSNSGIKTVDLYNAASDASRYLEVSASSEAMDGEYTLNEITQLAKASSIASSDDCKSGIEGSLDLSGLTYPLDLTGKTFSVTLDGISRDIDMSGTYADASTLTDTLGQKLDDVFGAGRIDTSLNASGGLSLTADNSVLMVLGGAEGADFLSEVGLTSGSKNIVNLDVSLEATFGEVENLSFKINGELFNFDKSTSLRDIMSEINASEANVRLTYSALTDRFTLSTRDTGAVSKIEIENLTGDLFGPDSYLNITESEVQNGQDAIFYLNDPTKSDPIYRSSNYTTVDGVSLQLKQANTEPIQYTVANDSSGVFEKIESFVEEFNELFKSISEKVSEKVYLDYEPLTDEQREEMSDTEIEQWEEKAKSGLLRQDSILSDMLRDMRNAFWDTTEGIGTSLFEVGVGVTDDYNTFQLEIDETKLKESIANDAIRVMELFNRQEVPYKSTLTAAERTERYETSGFAQRLQDIMKDNMRTTRDLSGQKGLLVEKAGLDGDFTASHNQLNDRMEKMDERIKDAIKKMNAKEDYFFKQFTAMETAIQRMNAQSEWLYAQFMG